jgi:hypothetical protein
MATTSNTTDKLWGEEEEEEVMNPCITFAIIIDKSLLAAKSSSGRIKWNQGGCFIYNEQ